MAIKHGRAPIKGLDRSLLYEVARIIRERPAVLRMNRWITFKPETRDDGEFSDEGDYGELSIGMLERARALLATCGTAACIAGHVILLRGIPEGVTLTGFGFPSVAARWLGLPPHRNEKGRVDEDSPSNQLFYAEMWPAPFREQYLYVERESWPAVVKQELLADIAARRIEWFADTWGTDMHCHHAEREFKTVSVLFATKGLHQTGYPSHFEVAVSRYDLWHMLQMMAAVRGVVDDMELRGASVVCQWTSPAFAYEALATFAPRPSHRSPFLLPDSLNEQVGSVLTGWDNGGIPELVAYENGVRFRWLSRERYPMSTWPLGLASSELWALIRAFQPDMSLSEVLADYEDELDPSKVLQHLARFV